MQIGWCAICGSDGHEEFAWKRANAEVVRRTRRSDALVRFVLCGQCGHVYQHPMLGREELTALYHGDDTAWDEHPADPHTMRVWGDWLLRAAPVGTRGAVLADFGGGVGAHLESFREAGWRIEAVPLPVTGGPIELIDPPSLVLMPHTLERLPDPIPVLKSLRRQMPPDGLLAVAAADLLAPRATTRDTQPWLADSHVRLYSFNSVQCLLARAGFRVECIRRVAGTGVIAVIAHIDEEAADPAYDDPVAVQQLYGALRRPGSADTLGHNLAALAEIQPGVLPFLCRRMDGGRYGVRRSGHCLVALMARNRGVPNGEEHPVVQWGDLDGYVETPDGSSHHTLVQLGLGSGELATALAEALRADQHLFIWEADAELAKTILEVVDLSPLWLSSQVSLLVGLHPYRTDAQRQRLREPSLVFSTRSARLWNTWGYRDIITRIGPEDESDDADVLEIAEAPQLSPR